MECIIFRFISFAPQKFPTQIIQEQKLNTYIQIPEIFIIILEKRQIIHSWEIGITMQVQNTHAKK